MPDAAAIDEAIGRIDQCIQAGRLDAAEPLCRELVQAAPQVANAWLRLGLVSLWKNSYAAAEDAFRRAAALAPHEPGIWSQLSLAVNRQGRGVEAEQFARDDRDSPRAHDRPETLVCCRRWRIDGAC